MAEDKLKEIGSSMADTGQIAAVINSLVESTKFQRKVFERKWYDNNFFDDGYHFRFLSRATNKIVDLSDRATIYSPLRAIPKASRQIRGIANLLLFNDPTPSVYPENISKSDYADEKEYQTALQEAQHVALRTGHWLTEEWKNQELMNKLTHMIILGLKHGVSYLQVWPDAVEEKIKTQIYDAFDIYLMGNLTSIYDSPFIAKGIPELITVLQANEDFDEDQRRKLSADNRYASSEVKEAYMMARYGREQGVNSSRTAILYETYFKEYLNQYNQARIRMQDDAGEILKGKKEGDMVIRQSFVANGVWLRDRYVNLPEYPFVDFRMEPGPIWQVPQMERFINANKSLDLVISRLERYSNTMVTGIWNKRRGEGFKINNVSGAQVIEYDVTPPVQGQIAPIPQFFFNFIELLQSFIEEQGVTTSTLGKIPAGVKANAAIESLKESELANLVIANRQVRKTIKHVSEKMLDIVDNYFVTPQTVYHLNKGQPDYFDIIGKAGKDKRKKVKVNTADSIVPIDGDYKVEIEIEEGAAYTKQGQKETAKDFAEYMFQLVTAGIVSPKVMKYVVEKLVESYKYGSYQELLEGMDLEGMAQEPVSDEALQKMKIAVLEALKDAGEIGPEGDQKDIDATKIGVLEALKDTGLLEKLGQDPKVQAELAKTQQEMAIKQQEHELKMAQGEQDMQIKKASTMQDLLIKQDQSDHGMRVKEKMIQQAKKGGNNANSKS